MYQRRLNDIQKAMNRGKLSISSGEISFISRMNQKKKSDYTCTDKEEINKLWNKIKS